MKIRFLPINIDGAGCYRCVFPAVWLTELGHDAGIPRFVIQDADGNHVPPLPLPGLQSVRPGDWNVGFEDLAEPCDVFVVQMGSREFQHEWAARAVKRGAKLVVDLDDDLHRVPAYNPGKGTPELRKLVTSLLARADLVTVATEELARFYGRWNDNVVVLPNRLHWPMWEPLAPVCERQEWRRFRVGYMGNMDYHQADVEQIAPSLKKWLVAHPDVEFVAAGDERIHDVIGVPHAQRVTTSKVWFRCLDLPYITSVMDVGLVPLVRNEFNEGKSCLKGMEYNACGIPVLASPTEEYRRWVTDGENGFVCRYPRDFVAALDVLHGDAELRRTMGRFARDAARASSLDMHVGAWEAAYAGVRDNSVDSLAGVAA